jgi:GAF domain-containing protein
MGTTDPVVDRADQLQYELREGPCVQVATVAAAHVVRTGDLAADGRWPRWGPRAAALGLRSILSAELRAQDRVLGALNLYGEHLRQFTGEDAATAHLFAAHAAFALAAESTTEHLQAALDTRTEIGQAQGILMERFDLSADRAFDVLRRYSQTTNTKLIEVAQTLIRTRNLPSTDS